MVSDVRAMGEEEQVDLVDEHDQVVGTKARRLLVDGVDRWRAVSLVVCDTAGRNVLLAHRSANKTHDPSRWAPCVAGTVTSGGGYLDTVLREAREEMGLYLGADQLAELYRGPWDSPGNLRMKAVYLVRRDVDVAEAVWDRSEADMIRWWAVTDARYKVASEPHRFAAGAGRMLELAAAHLSA